MSYPSPATRVMAVSSMILVLTGTALLLWFFHDRFWLPYDEGQYAHSAERLLDGEVLHRDIHEWHMGYVHFVNAAALKVFGRNLLSLRYPLMFCAFFQTWLMYRMFLSRGGGVALAAAFSLLALSWIQFMNPTPNWYALFLMVWIIYLLERGTVHQEPGHPSSFLFHIPHSAFYIPLGVLLMTLFLFRQLSGLFAGMAVFSYLLVSERQVLNTRQRLPGQILLGGLVFLLVGYFYKSSDMLGFMLFGFWPCAVGVSSISRVSVSPVQIGKMGLGLTAGALLAFAPLLAYHVWHGSLWYWYVDTIRDALNIPALPHLKEWSYTYFLSAAWQSVHTVCSGPRILNALFWAMLPGLAFLNGVALWRQRQRVGASTEAVLPWLALFYAPVSVFNQTPIYLFYSAGLSLCALLWLCVDMSGMLRRMVMGLAGLMIFVGTFYQAGQQFRTRYFLSTVAGERLALLRCTALVRAPLWMPAESCQEYTRLVELIHTFGKTGLFAFPNNAELYFLSGAPNRFRFHNTALGLRTAADVDALLANLRAQPPGLVINHRDSVYHTRISTPVLAWVHEHYFLIDRVGEFDVYSYFSRNG